MSIISNVMRGLRACGYHQFGDRLDELCDEDIDAAIKFAYGCAELLSMTEEECEWCQTAHPAPMHCAECGDDLIAAPEGVHEAFVQPSGYCPCAEVGEVEREVGHYLREQQGEDEHLLHMRPLEDEIRWLRDWRAA